jgi:hypothetical protein
MGKITLHVTQTVNTEQLQHHILETWFVSGVNIPHKGDNKTITLDARELLPLCHFTTRKESGTPLKGGLVDPRTGLDVFENTETFLPLS